MRGILGGNNHGREALRSGGGADPPNKALVERLPRAAGRRFITVSPMPRIDGGLELVTADGELAAKLQRSVRWLAIEFSVRVRGELGEQQLQGILSGTLDSGAHLAVERCEPAGGEAANRWYALAARGASGKDVRQLFERQGALVSRVLRTQLGPIALERSLGRGQFRELNSEDLRSLLSTHAAGFTHRAEARCYCRSGILARPSLSAINFNDFVFHHNVLADTLAILAILGGVIGFMMAVVAWTAHRRNPPGTETGPSSRRSP